LHTHCHTGLKKLEGTLFTVEDWLEQEDHGSQWVRASGTW